MATQEVQGSGTREDPWVLKTPSGSSEYQMFRDEALDPQLLVVAAAREVVAYGHLVTGGAQVQRGRPPKVSVTAKNQNLHTDAPMPLLDRDL